MGVQETIKQHFTRNELDSLTNAQFIWDWIPAGGHSGGVLLGVKEDILEVDDWMEKGDLGKN